MISDINLQEEIKVLLLRNRLTQGKLCKILKDKYNFKLKPSNFSLKLKNESICFSELKIICDILGYEIKIFKK